MDQRTKTIFAKSEALPAELQGCTYDQLQEIFDAQETLEKLSKNHRDEVFNNQLLRLDTVYRNYNLLRLDSTLLACKKQIAKGSLSGAMALGGNYKTKEGNPVDPYDISKDMHDLIKWIFQEVDKKDFQTMMHRIDSFSSLAGNQTNAFVKTLKPLRPFVDHVQKLREKYGGNEEIDRFFGDVKTSIKCIRKFKKTTDQPIEEMVYGLDSNPLLEGDRKANNKAITTAKDNLRVLLTSYGVIGMEVARDQKKRKVDHKTGVAGKNADAADGAAAGGAGGTADATGVAGGAAAPTGGDGGAAAPTGGDGKNADAADGARVAADAPDGAAYAAGVAGGAADPTDGAGVAANAVAEAAGGGRGAGGAGGGRGAGGAGDGRGAGGAGGGRGQAAGDRGRGRNRGRGSGPTTTDPSVSIFNTLATAYGLGIGKRTRN